MLGRKAAVAVTIFAFTGLGGGVAMAATHSGSHSSKAPATKTPERSTRSGRSMGGPCPNMGGSSSNSSYSGAGTATAL